MEISPSLAMFHDLVLWFSLHKSLYAHDKNGARGKGIPLLSFLGASSPKLSKPTSVGELTRKKNPMTATTMVIIPKQREE